MYTITKQIVLNSNNLEHLHRAVPDPHSKPSNRHRDEFYFGYPKGFPKENVDRVATRATRADLFNDLRVAPRAQCQRPASDAGAWHETECLGGRVNVRRR